VPHGARDDGANSDHGGAGFVGRHVLVCLLKKGARALLGNAGSCHFSGEVPVERSSMIPDVTRALLQQAHEHVTADEPGAAGDQNWPIVTRAMWHGGLGDSIVDPMPKRILDSPLSTADSHVGILLQVHVIIESIPLKLSGVPG